MVDPNWAPGPRGTISRRNALRWTVATASLALAGAVAGVGAVVGDRDQKLATPGGLAAAPGSGVMSAASPSSGPGRPLTVTSGTSPPQAGQSALPAWYGQAPIRSLADYVRRVPGAPAFPDNAVMLTIDDGPHPVWTPKILRLLEQYHVKATFCIIGRQAVTYPDLVHAAVAEGHHLANHSYSHPSRLQLLSARDMSAQVIDTQDAIVRASGFTPRQFRAPGGQWSPALTRLAAQHDLLCVDWNVDPRDWSKPGATKIINTMLKARAGDVLLCHDGGGDRSQTYAALATVLPKLKARGLQFVTLPAPQPQP